MTGAAAFGDHRPRILRVSMGVVLVYCSRTRLRRPCSVACLLRGRCQERGAHCRASFPHSAVETSTHASICTICANLCRRAPLSVPQLWGWRRARASGRDPPDRATAHVAGRNSGRPTGGAAAFGTRMARRRGREELSTGVRAVQPDAAISSGRLFGPVGESKAASQVQRARAAPKASQCYPIRT